jgi:protocatechuate 3,4-dioxygenase beta subunit
MRCDALLIALSFLVVASGAAGQPRCAPTARDVEGPFYKPGAPVRAATGKGLVVSGAVKSAATCEAIRGARVEWWQANPGGEYDDSHRGALTTPEDGGYRFETDFPPPYFGRPSHIHLKAFAAGYRPLTTQLYLRGGERDVTFDLVLTEE